MSRLEITTFAGANMFRHACFGRGSVHPPSRAWIARCTIGRRSVKLFRLGRKEDARLCIDIAQSRSATSRGQDENSFGGTRADRWTQQKSGARISFEARRLVTPA